MSIMKKKHRRAVYVGLTIIPLFVSFLFLGISIILNYVPKAYIKYEDWLKTKLRVYDYDPD